MPKSANQKFKILYLMKMFLETSDEQNPITVSQMIDELALYDIKAERKSIYDDIDALRVYGLDIIKVKGKTTGYFIASRDFEIPELKLLVDAVQCSKFITPKKSKELIKKLEGLASRYQAKHLHREVCLANRPKTYNESIYLNVDIIHEAISKKREIRFKYFDYSLNKRKVYRKDGDFYYTSPYGLSWDDEHYYLIAFSEKHDDFIHYRVDRMSDVEIMEEFRIPLPRGEVFNLADYSKKVFRMFGGEGTKVEMWFDNSLVNVVIDRFGKDIRINKRDDSTFTIKTEVVLSAPFYAWIFQFMDKAGIVSPEFAVEEFTESIEKILLQYNKGDINEG